MGIHSNEKQRNETSSTISGFDSDFNIGSVDNFDEDEVLLAYEQGIENGDPLLLPPTDLQDRWQSQFRPMRRRLGQGEAIAATTSPEIRALNLPLNSPASTASMQRRHWCFTPDSTSLPSLSSFDKMTTPGSEKLFAHSAVVGKTFASKVSTGKFPEVELMVKDSVPRNIMTRESDIIRMEILAEEKRSLIESQPTKDTPTSPPVDMVVADLVAATDHIYISNKTCSDSPELQVQRRREKAEETGSDEIFQSKTKNECNLEKRKYSPFVCKPSKVEHTSLSPVQPRRPDPFSPTLLKASEIHNMFQSDIERKRATKKSQSKDQGMVARRCEDEPGQQLSNIAEGMIVDCKPRPKQHRHRRKQNVQSTSFTIYCDPNMDRAGSVAPIDESLQASGGPNSSSNPASRIRAKYRAKERCTNKENNHPYSMTNKRVAPLQESRTNTMLSTKCVVEAG